MTKIALGTVKFGTEYGINPTVRQVNFKEVKKILTYANSKNLTVLDTARSYGDSEKILGRANVSDFKVVTKTRYFDNLQIKENDVEQLKIDFFTSLKKLKLDSVYAILFHNADDLLKPNALKLVQQLKQFKKEKKLTKIGVSIYDQNQLQTIINNFDINIVQLPVNILDRRFVDNGTLMELKKKQIEVHARSVFLQGLLLMSEEYKVKKFNRWAGLWRIWHEWLNDNKLTALEATIRYVISVQEISKVLVGVDSQKQLEQIMTSSQGILPNIPLELTTSDVDLLNPSNWGKV